MKLIVGLGNPGKKYEGTRHNVGFMVIDQLQRNWNFPAFEISKWKAEVSEGEFEDERILLVKPLTYMNLSGEAVSKVVGFYKIPLTDLWVVYDDVDLPLGKIRIREKGSPGTHNGIKSIVEKLGSEKFPRFRFGIETRKESSHERDTTAFVLGKFKRQEHHTWKRTIFRMCEALEFALQKGISKAMEQYNP